jgi:hypothetical protein
MMHAARVRTKGAGGHSPSPDAPGAPLSTGATPLHEVCLATGGDLSSIRKDLAERVSEVRELTDRLAAAVRAV